jgi:hypothetical protein
MIRFIARVVPAPARFARDASTAAGLEVVSHVSLDRHGRLPKRAPWLAAGERAV